jgi:hypothetical protein
MWLITTFVAGVIVTAIWFIVPRKYQVGFLALMLWGLGAMLIVDHVLGYEGGPFIEMETDGLIENGTVLGIAMLIPVFMIWEFKLLFSRMRGELVEPTSG